MTHTDLLAAFDDEVVTHALVRDVELPGGGGTLALVTLDNGRDHTKPSTFGPRGLLELRAALERCRERATAGEIVAVGITGKPFVFAVGADLTGVPSVTDREQAVAMGRLGHETFALLPELGVPSFAFVNGAAMGGGVEVALACDYRTISASVPAVALPEVFLGLVPGWGGCWTLPNLIGVEGALKVVIDNPLSNNTTLSGAEAARLGLADQLLEPADFLERSLAWAGQVVRGEVAVERPDVDRDEAAWEGAIAAARRAVTARTGGSSRSAYRALDLLSAARTASREEGFAAEDEALGDLLMSDELRAGLYAFDLVQRRARKPAGAPDTSLARPVTKVGIVGAGLMASQLALLFVRRLEVPVIMTDLDQERVDKGVAHVHAEIDKLAAKGRLDQDRVNRYKALISGDTTKAGMADVELVIEAVFEEMSVKQQVWAEVEAVVSPECVLASNTSSLSITQMASRLEHPERVVGLHFFNPVAVMPLLEVITGERTDDATLATAFAVGRQLKKTTVLCADSPSFIVNRLLGRFMSDMARIVDAGTPIDVADQGFAGIAPMPPFVLMGLVGPAIALHNNESLAAAFPDRFYVSPALRRVVEAGKRGYYTQVEGRTVLDPEVLALQESPTDPVVLTPEQVREQVLAGLAEEARIMLDEGVVSAPMDLDLAMITGAGFQFWNGGLTPLLDRTGTSERVTGRRFLPPGTAEATR
ncbi:3-hydroxyacyl-CoA dehydrogenase NAD-binding domain-containing protein [uncultured Arsenicicoccus sp.]|uniref:3-hydroxyacyl-CoA dehydrogenase NAD-binding domain-containing protein n=1 Tax=uncultured Arsenicicoccus sp. TaxID=491339 RepID=UPI0025973303|nr:3-hydroxyacyl-CoA dehydrogenase NAD-binding domain-containing protein [uncultured Arsenicicoccus sp.]